MRYVIKLLDVPESCTVEEYVRVKTDIKKHFKMKPERELPTLMRMTLTDYDSAKVLESVEEAFSKYGCWGFWEHLRDSNRSTHAGGLSLTYNPELNNGSPEHASTLGDPRVNLHDLFKTDKGVKVWLDLERRGLSDPFFQVVREQGLPGGRTWLEKQGVSTDWYPDWNRDFKNLPRSRKNSYGDGMSFRIRTKAATEGELGRLLGRVKRSMIRSRVGTLSAGIRWTPEIAHRMWHRDEEVFINLRMNFPLSTTPDFLLEIDKVGRFHLDVGSIYSWNTEVMHRVFTERYIPNSTFKRTHLVVGSSPWLDYDHEAQTWTSNEFYGQKHPFDMLLDGDVIPGLSLAADA